VSSLSNIFSNRERSPKVLTGWEDFIAKNQERILKIIRMQQQLLKKIRLLVVFFIIVLALSGITAFPVYSELSFLHQHGWMNKDQFFGPWLNKVYSGVGTLTINILFCLWI
jgi:hypothetical protein